MDYSIIYAQNVSSFLLNCRGEFEDDNVCSRIRLYLSSSDDSDIEINCYGRACRNIIFYAKDSISAVSKGINIESYCQCPDDDYSDCVQIWSIYCGDDYETLIWFYPNDPDGEQCKISMFCLIYIRKLYFIYILIDIFKIKEWVQQQLISVNVMIS